MRGDEVEAIRAELIEISNALKEDDLDPDTAEIMISALDSRITLLELQLKQAKERSLGDGATSERSSSEPTRP